MVEFTAESILQCSVSSLTEPPAPPADPNASSTWNPSDKSSDSIALSNGNLTAKVTDGAMGSNGVRATTSRTSGKLYLEFTVGAVNSGSDYTCIGITTGSQSLTGIASTFGVNSFIVMADTGVFYNGSNSGIPDAGGSSGLAHAVWGFAIDFDNMLIWVRKDSGSWNGNGTFNPSSGVGGFGISSVFGLSAAFPVFSPSNNSAVTVNFGGLAFSSAIPSGFSPWG